MATNHTIQDEMREASGATAGFDYLRIGLALAVLVWHSIGVSTGSASLDQALWSGPFRFLPAAILPMFFALSGFLVAGSLERTKTRQFVTLRVLRLVPALAVEVTLSALIFGAAFTTLPLRDYLTSAELHRYFGNIVGFMHYSLPGVFEGNPVPRLVNFQLWTIPYELECYLALVLASLSTIMRQRTAFVAATILFTLAATIIAIFFFPASPFDHVPGRALVMSFLAAVCLHKYRDKIPYSPVLGIGAAIASAALLRIPNDAYLAAWPVAYLTMWLGLMRPPKIPFGDLSYGVYLFHFPLEQSIVHLFPAVNSWWRLTLMAASPSVLCAWLSWNLIERPVLSRKTQIVSAVDRAWASAARVAPAVFPWRERRRTATSNAVARAD